MPNDSFEAAAAPTGPDAKIYSVSQLNRMASQALDTVPAPNRCDAKGGRRHSTSWVLRISADGRGRGASSSSDTTGRQAIIALLTAHAASTQQLAEMAA